MDVWLNTGRIGLATEPFVMANLLSIATTSCIVVPLLYNCYREILGGMETNEEKTFLFLFLFVFIFLLFCIVQQGSKLEAVK